MGGVSIRNSLRSNKTKYGMHDGHDKKPTWSELVVNKKRVLQNVGAIGKAAVVSCKRSYEGRAAMITRNTKKCKKINQKEI